MKIATSLHILLAVFIGTAPTLVRPSYGWQFANDWMNVADLCDDSQWRCPPANFPVCGSDGVTYINECALAKKQCVVSDLAMTTKSICGKDGDGAGYPDVLSCQGQTSVSCPPVCSPVCDSNGQTYTSECSFMNAKCMDDSITLVSEGVCASDPTWSEGDCGAVGGDMIDTAPVSAISMASPKLERSAMAASSAAALAILLILLL